jgi:hypothetical protein
LADEAADPKSVSVSVSKPFLPFVAEDFFPFVACVSGPFDVASVCKSTLELDMLFQ